MPVVVKNANPWQDEIGFIPHLPEAPDAINSDSFDEDVLQSPVPVLVEFWAARCGPCRRLAPELAQAARELGSRARVFSLNVDDEPEAAAQFGVLSIPTTLLFVGGKEAARLHGVLDHATLLSALQPFITSPELRNS